MHPLHTNTTPTVGKTPCLMHYSALPAHKHNTNSRANTVSDALLNPPCTQTQHRQSGKHRVWCTAQHSLQKHDTTSREHIVSDSFLNTLGYQKIKQKLKQKNTALWWALGTECHGFKSYQSHGILLPRPRSAVGPNGKAGTTQLSFTHFPDASLGVSF